jgi:ATP-dependent DNA helicase RecG
MHVLDTSIEYLKGVGPQRADILKKELDIFTFGDLLHYFPFRYVDRTQLVKVNDITDDDTSVQLRGTLSGLKLVGDPSRKRLVATLEDDTGYVELVWFKGVRWIKEALKNGKEYIVFGRPAFYRGKFSIAHPDLQLADDPKLSVAGKLEAVYSTTEKLTVRGLDSKGIGRLVRTLIERLDTEELGENLPPQILSAHKLMPREEALFAIHIPETREDADRAVRRFKFEELFLLQLGILRLKIGRESTATGFPFPELGHYFNTFFKDHLTFELTAAQKRVLKEIRKDLLSGKQMNRLLQGDVGSGKTIVALMIMLMACDNGFQACLMAPTEILAQQHFRNLREPLARLGLQTALFTGAVKGATRSSLLNALKSGAAHIAVGTHALIEENVEFKNLGLVVIDEQHRFGVAQRAELWKKSDHPPHVLVMTATPIPRTLAMTVYGDLEVSVIDELPPGRKPIRTEHRFESARLKVFNFLKQEIRKGRQVYIVYPLIHESEKLDLKNLMEGYEAISRDFSGDEFRIGVLHGQMKPEDKDFEMQRFASGKSNILVSTMVIEVGMDVSNATVMVIENAERFGLSQLHQLRGRVGRGAEQAYCILMTSDRLGQDARQRIRAMTDTNDGFKIAELDLQLRGPGDIEGTRQSGDLHLRIANVVTDQKIVSEAREAAQALLADDPRLSHPRNFRLHAYLSSQNKEEIAWSRIG